MMMRGAPSGSGALASLLKGLNGRRRLLRMAGSLAAIRVLGLGCVFGLQVLLARVMGDAASYGTYAWGQSLLFLLGGVATLGLPLAAARFVAVLAGRGDVVAARSVIARARRHLLSAGVLLLALAAAAALLLPAYPVAGAPRTVLALALAGAPLLAWMLLGQQVARAWGWVALAFAPAQLLRPLLTGLLVLGAWRGLGMPLDAVGGLAMVVASVALVALFQEGMLNRRLNALGGVTTEHSDVEYSPDRLLAVGLPIMLTRAANLLSTHASTLLLGVLSGPAAAGSFFAAKRLAELVSLPQQVASAVTQPMLARAHADRTPGHFERLAWITTQLAFWPTLCAAILLLVFGTSVLALFGRDFTAALPVLGLLLLANCVGVASGAHRDVLLMAGLQRPLARISVLTLVMQIGALLVVLPQHGALGAAVVHCVKALVGAVAGVMLVRRRIGLRVALWDTFRLFSRKG